ncbi:phospholipase D family protein [Gymnodinialimonas ceratoperidinii]|uniref:PLD phosphodiesterase domain-containing protein n=1 Tax=Gymnodinialimonas ceratoperidinii TaxID=2856823 RepID=A0A8F6TUB6_9RHOB|nr:hypothetical protein [Gymnodinialimonas ceratoperidinii]QXT39102.1 hypothetical protein KYE46_14390 [Gymnodinialimonas ceratoperidinii]
MTTTDKAERPITDLDVYFSASEAFPAFEKLCLGAKRNIIGCFRVFDTATPLRSAEGREIGETWFDLLLHVLNRGVAIDLTVSDFDPIVATDEHRRSWRTARQLAALDELSGNACLTFRIAMHPARVGYLPRRALKGMVAAELEAREPDPLTPGLHGLEPSDDLPLRPATHHQKIAVIDEEVVYVGGLDLNERRYDTWDHDQSAEQTWQDIQAVARGPVVAAAVAHLKSFRAVTAGEADPVPQAPGFLRTMSCRRQQDLTYISPRSLVTELEEMHLAAVARAKGLVYLETQFFRHAPLAQALVDAANQNENFACILVIPAAPEDRAFNGNDREDAMKAAQMQVKALGILTKGLGERLALAAPAQPRQAVEVPETAVIHGAPLIYVHSKLSLFGPDEAIISSANLNGRSFKWDTEVGLHLTEREMVEPLWDRALRHWLRDDVPDLNASPVEVVAHLNALLAENAAAAPQERSHFLLPFDHSDQLQLARPVPFIPDEMV